MSDQKPVDASTESKPLREKLMPQASIRFFLALIGASALIMMILREAAAEDARWILIPAVLIATAGACFMCYALLFLVASMFAGSRKMAPTVSDASTDKRTF